MRDKGVIVVSLNSQKYSSVIDNELKLDLKEAPKTIDVLSFDNMEVLNRLFFNTESAAESKNYILKISKGIQGAFREQKVNVESFINFNSLQNRLSHYVKTVYIEYIQNRSFRNNVHNQIFRNLQPKLNGLDIRNSRDTLLEILAPFLLKEIAFYLSTYDSECYECILGLEDEMKIIQDLRTEKYPVFCQFLKYDCPYVKIDVVPNA